MKIVIDGRVFSTAASQRGMGNYSRELVLRLHEAGFDLSFIGYRMSRIQFENELDLFKIEPENYFELSFDPNHPDDSHSFSSTTATIENAISKLEGEVYFDLTPFIYPPRIDIALVPTVTVLYDLIPLLMESDYLTDLNHREQYLLSLRSIKKSQMVITISESVAEMAREFLNIDPNKIEMIYPIIENNSQNPLLSNSVNLDYGFVMGGTHPSKNPEKISQFCKAASKVIALGELVVLFPSKGDIQRFQKYLSPLPDNIIFLENVSKSEKNQLLAGSKVFLHFSVLEGFGIPVQEAIQYHVPVIALDTTLNQEMNLTNELFSAECTGEELVSRFLLRLRLPRVKPRIKATKTSESDYLRIFRKIANLGQVEDNRVATLNLISPLQPIECGISELSSEILKSYSELGTRIAVYVDDQKIPLQIENCNLNFFSVNSFELHRSKSPSFFQLGGSSWFTGVFRALNTQQHGARYAFVHDLDISGGLKDICRIAGLREFYREIVGYEDSKNLDGPLLNWLNVYFDRIYTHVPRTSWPTNLDVSKWVYVPQGRKDSPSHRELFLAAWPYLATLSTSYFGVFGSVLRNKRIERVLDAITLLDEKIHVVIAGRTPDLDYLNELKEMVNRLGIEKRVHFFSSPTEDLFYSLMSRSTTVISMRDNKLGQISGPILQAFSLGNPVLMEMSDYWSDLADGAPLKLPPNPTAVDIANLVTILFDNTTIINEFRKWSSEKYSQHSVRQMTNSLLLGNL